MTAAPITHENQTAAQYMSLAQAFDYLNATLFAGGLPSVLVTFQRHANSRGYFAPGMFAARVGSDETTPTTDEIALNPDTFRGRTDEEIFSTLAHEMAHLWQAVHGKLPKNGYHDKQWADCMERIGLMPSDTGLPGGKRTGARVTHYILPGGLFAQSYAALRARGVCIAWESSERSEAAKKKSKSKTKFTCASCGQNAWGKPETKIACVPCDLPMLSSDETETGED